MLRCGITTTFTQSEFQQKGENMFKVVIYTIDSKNEAENNLLGLITWWCDIVSENGIIHDINKTTAYKIITNKWFTSDDSRKLMEEIHNSVGHLKELTNFRASDNMTDEERKYLKDQINKMISIIKKWNEEIHLNME